MRCLAIMLIAGVLAGCGEMQTPTGVKGDKKDGRIYVENEGTFGGADYVLEDPRTGQSGLWARVKKVDDQLIEGELKEIPYRGGPVEITSEAIPGGSTAIVHFRLTYPGGKDWYFPFEIDSGIVIKVTSVKSDVQGLHYEVRPYGW